MTARGTDWSLAALVALLAATGIGTAFAGAGGDAWVFVVHGAAGFALGGTLGWKLRRVLGRLRNPSRWDRRTRLGVVTLASVTSVLVSGWAWSAGAASSLTVAGYNLLNAHVVLGVVLSALVLGHALVRAKRPRRADLASRRQFLRWAAVGTGSLAVWWLQDPISTAVGLRGGRRRFTGSYEADSFAGNVFPTTSWVSDSPRVLDRRRHTVEVVGLVDRPARLSVDRLDRGDSLVATLDCTGGFHSRQRWRGVRLGRLLDGTGVQDGADHVRVISHTGYRYSFAIADARRMLLAVSVGDEPLSHGHGAPVRLVAPGHRGFQWVKWVVRIEVHEGSDPGALASTVWSSFTPEGRGA